MGPGTEQAIRSCQTFGLGQQGQGALHAEHGAVEDVGIRHRDGRAERRARCGAHHHSSYKLDCTSVGSLADVDRDLCYQAW